MIDSEYIIIMVLDKNWYKLMIQKAKVVMNNCN